MDDPQPTEKLNFKRVLPVFIIVLVDVLGLTIIIPLLPLYSAAFGANAFVIGLLSAMYPLMQFIASPVLGSLSDKFGRKPILIISQIGTLSGFILLGFANALPLLFLSRIIDGISGGNIAIAKAAIADSTTDKTRTQGLGLIGAAFGIGFVIGPAISAVVLLLTGGNFHAPAFVAAIFSLSSIMLTTFWFKETHQAPDETAVDDTRPRISYWQRVQMAFSHPVIGGLLILMFVQQLVLGGFEQIIPLFTLNRLGMDGSGNALLFVFMGVLVAVVQGYLIGPLNRKFGERGLIYGGMLMLAVGVIGASMIPEQPMPGYSQAETIARLQVNNSDAEIGVSLPDDGNTGWLGIGALFVMMVPVTVGGYLVMPSINSLLTQQTLASEHGRILGISTSVMSFSHILAPIMGGALFRWFGSSAPFLMGGIFILVVILMLPAPFTLRLSFLEPALRGK
ncbi:MAG: MFS transporter [Anaerolineae bacterium]